MAKYRDRGSKANLDNYSNQMNPNNRKHREGLAPFRPFPYQSRDGTVAQHQVVLVSLDWLRPGDPPFGLGVASIAASLHYHGVDVRIVSDAVNRTRFSYEGFLTRVLEAASEADSGVLIGISAFVWCEQEVQILLKDLAPRFDVVLGGPQISYMGKGMLEALYPGACYFVRGQGEMAMVMLAMGCARNGLHGLHVAGESDLETRADFPLDALPSPHLDGTSPIGSFVRWETQRGCQFSCSFCQHKQPDNRLRNVLLGEERLQQEIYAFHDAGTGKIAVLDPIFNADTGRAVELLREIGKMHPKTHFSFQCRFEMVTDAFLDAVEPLNTTLEFGLQTVHPDEARAVNRPNNIGKVQRVMDKLEMRHIPYEVSLIYGLPFQTLERFQSSVDWCQDLGVPRIRAWPLMLLRGTKIHVEREKWGYVESVGGRIPVVVESRWFTQDDHAKMSEIADALA